MNLIFIGLPNSGKSYWAKKTASFLGLEMVDTDHRIEVEYRARSGKRATCRQIYKTHGDVFFRAIETDVLSALKKMQGQVIALGGGAVLVDKNYPLVQGLGKIVYLKTSIESLQKRFPKKPPPYLAGLSLKDFMEMRTPFYERWCDATLVLDDKSEEQILKEIIGILRFN